VLAKLSLQFYPYLLFIDLAAVLALAVPKIRIDRVDLKKNVSIVIQTA
jgi:hypothetical protein